VAVVTLAAGIYLDLFPRLYLLMLAVLLAYPLAAQALAWYLERKGQRQQEAARVLVQLDALFIGLAIAALHFAVVPSVALLIIVHANAVTSGGLKPWLLNLCLTLVGAALGSLVFGFQWLSPAETPLGMSLVALIGLGVFVGASSFASHQQTKLIQQAQAHVAQQQKQAVELSRKLAKYLPPQIWGQLFSGKRDATLGTRRKKLTVFFSDIKGFSNISEELPLATLTEMLNSYLTEMTRIALRHGGTVDKFIGDAVMVFFGDPKSQGSKQDAYNCVAMAIEMQQQMKMLRQKWRRQGITQKLEIRIGINTGYVTVGNFGAESRMDYTILGTDVNLASRLESRARPGHILVSEATHELIKDRILCRDSGEVEVKGFERPIPVFEVVDMRSNAGSQKRFLSVETQGFALHMDLERLRNFDKNRILHALASSAKGMKAGETVQTDFEAEGFALHLDSTRIKKIDRDRVMESMAGAARKVKERLVI
jgi:class 3 adenylate cyclase